MVKRKYSYIYCVFMCLAVARQLVSCSTSIKPVRVLEISLPYYFIYCIPSQFLLLVVNISLYLKCIYECIEIRFMYLVFKYNKCV